MMPWLLYSGDLRVPTYFFMLMLGFALATGLIVREARRTGLPEREVIDLAIVMVPCMLIGARLFHAIFERPTHYLENPGALLSFSGGLVFYGGFAAGSVVAILWSRRTGTSPWTYADIFCPAVAFGLIFGRLGCLGAGCGFGKPATWPLDWAVPWAVRYYRRGVVPEELLAIPLHPAPLYESLGCLFLFVWLSGIRARQRFSGEVALSFLWAYAVLRFVVEYFRADLERGVYLDGWLSTSQAIGLLCCIFTLAIWRKRAAP